MGGEGGESTHWGDILIGKNKALVEVDTMLAGGVKLPFKKKEWGPSKYTFQHFEQMKDKKGKSASVTAKARDRIYPMQCLWASTYHSV